MTAERRLIGDTWNLLQPFVREQKCVGCECLQGALTELCLGLEDLAPGDERQRLLSAITGAMAVQDRHGCLGCEPCTPGNTLAAYYREQQARELLSPCACKDG
jgi:Pyruvate/2-oxoacid:ferredoxin oxidoreductase delta subunit